MQVQPCSIKSRDPTVTSSGHTAASMRPGATRGSMPALCGCQPQPPLIQAAAGGMLLLRLVPLPRQPAVKPCPFPCSL